MRACAASCPTPGAGRSAGSCSPTAPAGRLEGMWTGSGRDPAAPMLTRRPPRRDRVAAALLLGGRLRRQPVDPQRRPAGAWRMTDARRAARLPFSQQSTARLELGGRCGFQSPAEMPNLSRDGEAAVGREPASGKQPAWTGRRGSWHYFGSDVDAEPPSSSSAMAGCPGFWGCQACARPARRATPRTGVRREVNRSPRIQEAG